MNQSVKIGIVVVLLVAAVIITVKFTLGGEEAAQVADETKTLWMCAGCADTSEFTVKQTTVMAREAGPPAPPLICAKCKEKKVYRAMRCDKCQTAYFTSDVPDATGVCPKCNPDYKPPIVDEPTEEAPTEEGPAGEKDEATPVRVKKKVKAA